MTFATHPLVKVNPSKHLHFSHSSHRREALPFSFLSSSIPTIPGAMLQSVTATVSPLILRLASNTKHHHPHQSKPGTHNRAPIATKFPSPCYPISRVATGSHQLRPNQPPAGHRHPPPTSVSTSNCSPGPKSALNKHESGEKILT